MTNSQPKTEPKKAYLQAFVRLSRIHDEIAAGKFPSIKELADKTNAHERTIKRDLDILRNQFNAPIVYERKQKGFRYAEIGWTFPLSNLNEKEILAVFIAENALKLTGHLPEAQDLRKALAKLVSYLPEKISYDLATLSDNISFESPAYELSEPEIRQQIAKSATELTTIEFDYFSPHSQKPSRRKVDVYLLHNFGGDWYAISYDHNRKAMRDFHVGRISNLKVTNEGFEIRKKIWNKEDYLKKGFNMMRGGKLTKVEIWFDAYQAQWIRKRKHFHLDEKREELPDRSLRLSFEIGENGLEAVARFCLQYAGNCIAEKPKRLREIILEKLEKALREHK
jgi:predicted DNA-binding transcriptional regulator YafY